MNRWYSSSRLIRFLSKILLYFNGLTTLLSSERCPRDRGIRRSFYQWSYSRAACRINKSGQLHHANICHHQAEFGHIIEAMIGGKHPRSLVQYYSMNTSRRWSHPCSPLASAARRRCPWALANLDIASSRQYTGAAKLALRAALTQRRWLVFALILNLSTLRCISEPIWLILPTLSCDR